MRPAGGPAWVKSTTATKGLVARGPRAGCPTSILSLRGDILPAAGATPGRRHGLFDMTAAGPRRARAVALRWLTVALLAAVAALVARRARAIDWQEVGESLAGYGPATLAGAALLTVLSYLLYAGYELLGRAYTGHRLPRPRVVAIALVSYAFNLNLGAWIGGIGFRYRLYLRGGLKAALIARILGVSLVTNWLGYLGVAGAALVLQLAPVPPRWPHLGGALQALGAVLIGGVAAYVLACGRRRSTRLRVRGVEIRFPPLEMALTQVGLSVANWLVIAGILYVLLRHEVPYHTVLPVLLMASVAGVVAHIPAGLGVIEAVFFAMLGDSVPQDDLVAALLAYRGVYYLAPLAVAIAVYFVLEARVQGHAVAGPAGGPPLAR